MNPYTVILCGSNPHEITIGSPLPAICSQSVVVHRRSSANAPPPGSRGRWCWRWARTWWCTNDHPEPGAPWKPQDFTMNKWRFHGSFMGFWMIWMEISPAKMGNGIQQVKWPCWDHQILGVDKNAASPWSSWWTPQSLHLEVVPQKSPIISHRFPLRSPQLYSIMEAYIRLIYIIYIDLMIFGWSFFSGFHSCHMHRSTPWNRFLLVVWLNVGYPQIRWLRKAISLHCHIFWQFGY